MNASTASQILFASVNNGTLDSSASRMAKTKRAMITRNCFASAAMRISGRMAKIFDPRIKTLQQPSFVRDFFSLEGVLQPLDERSKAALHNSTRFRTHGEPFAAAFSPLKNTQPSSRKIAIMTPQPNMADITYPKAGCRTNGGAY